MYRCRFAVSAALAVVLLTALPAPAVEPPPDAPIAGEVDPAVAHLARMRGITAIEAKARIDLQDALIDRAAALHDDPAFGGLWIDDTDRVVVASTTDHARAEQRVALGDLADEARFVVVDHSADDLERASDRLFALVSGLSGDDALGVSTHVDLEQNQVVLTLPRDEAQRTRLGALADAARAGFGSILAIEDTGTAATALACAWPDCDPPLRGGTKISVFPPPGSGGFSSWCTSALIARSVSDAKLYLMTAGHCTRGWLGVKAQTASGTMVTVGQTHNEHIGQYGDFGIIQVTNESFWSSAPWVVVLPSSGTPPTTANDQYTIVDESTSTIGQVVCKTGNTTSTTCGQITAKGASAYYPDYGWVSSLGIASLGAAPGDSGSPFYKQNEAYGILSGGDSRGTLYSGINLAEKHMRVEVSNP